MAAKKKEPKPKKPKREDPQLRLLDPGEAVGARSLDLKGPERAIWSERKAELVRRYLGIFVMVAKRGVYIDGFAGAQRPDDDRLWVAKRVLETQSRDRNHRALRHFYLFEKDRKKIPALEELAKNERNGRTVEVIAGDFNVNVRTLLEREAFPKKEATFALLDQHTFECEWSTLQQLAFYKPKPKIELFYFLANDWLPRAIANTTTNVLKLSRWWGRADWNDLVKMKPAQRAELMCERLRKELGYLYVTPWEIRREPNSPKVMYFMLHASDHAEAPLLMARAYNNAHLSDRKWEQEKEAVQLELVKETKP